MWSNYFIKHFVIKKWIYRIPAVLVGEQLADATCASTQEGSVENEEISFMKLEFNLIKHYLQRQKETEDVLIRFVCTAYIPAKDSHGLTRILSLYGSRIVVLEYGLSTQLGDWEGVIVVVECLGS